ncbi:C4-dicarboxylate TRAP transporter substrate-binding protein [Pacificitalea manganoxidans]|jgi:TRAP-type C4-dicarboxylate transport system substrate-binding protein|nr:C4-dicarboxylate TRAP transporter substrate-binding protein [Pacificitalea manganoxidans]MDR6310239.1 TRAP-type C4-dicarboxylate transport system substrate-binding protein [Pacificitalea manganoxidans]
MKYAAICAASALALYGSAAVAQETIRLTTVSGYPTTAAWVGKFEEIFVPEVDKRLAETGNYEIDWTYGWGGAIVAPKGELEAIESGLADIGVVQTVFHPDRLRVYDIAYSTPFVSTDIDLISATVNDLAEKYPAMQQVWEDNNQHMLTVLAAVDNYQIFLKGDYAGPESLSGLKLGGAGMNLRYVENVGATGVSSTLADFYNGIATGIFDGTMVWATAAEDFKIYEAAPTIVEIDFGGVNSMALSINQQAWDGMPDEVRTALNEAAEVYRKGLARYSMDEAAKAMENMVANGATLVEVSDEDRKVWADGMANIAGEWAGEVSAMGAPGQEILTDYIAAMRAADQPVMRDWSAQ